MMVRRIARLLWSTFDNIILLQMGSAYYARLGDFATAKHSVLVWRKEQQDEWDRLSRTVRTYYT